MYTLNRTGRTRSTNIWPGFVDGLATLLLVVIFVLMVFVVAQYFLSVALSGRDERLARLDRQIAELSELLALEQETSSDLRSTLDTLTSELQASVDLRETLTSELAGLEEQRDSLASQLAALARERDQLEGELAAVVESRDDLRQRLIDSQREGETLDESLLEAQRTIEADRETIQVQLNELALLRDLREELEAAVADRERELRATEALLAESRAALSESEQRVAEQEARLAGQEERLEQQAGEIELSRTTLERLEAMLAAREAELAEREESLQARSSELALSEETLQRVRAQLMERDRRIDELEAQLASLDARDRDRLDELETLRAARDALLSRLMARGEQVAGLQQRLAQSQDFAMEQQELSETAQQRVALLNRQLAALQRQLAAVQAALEASEAREREQNVQIADLGRRLNAALASRVQELARYRSEFFGRLREILGDNPNIRIVGDRFVFQAEVLFPSGSDALQQEGREQISQLAGLLRDLAERIPDDIDWVLRVDGHTDRRPIATPLFPSNWELSSARAISVVRLLLQEGIPANRLVAAGFGEHQPLDPQDSEEAYQRNRRIELKLTER